MQIQPYLFFDGRCARHERLFRRLPCLCVSIGKDEPLDFDHFEIYTPVWKFVSCGGGKTKYTARVLHWTVADRAAHEKMSFHQGWGQCADQLVALVTKN